MVLFIAHIDGSVVEKLRTCGAVVLLAESHAIIEIIGGTSVAKARDAVRERRKIIVSNACNAKLYFTKHLVFSTEDSLFALATSNKDLF